ncbi:hypothetical protein AB0L13_07145 [Saccharopolyspora shandongensis]|uniref:hypothetical protein n=1 Tax=Saccharopolyspora shandongensis TaxID=418495 RepID=UPI00343F79AA
MEILHSFGVTTFQDAGTSRDIMRALHDLDTAGELAAWVVSSMLINDPIFGFAPVGAELLAEGERYRSTHHRPDFVKIFLDAVGRAVQRAGGPGRSIGIAGGDGPAGGDQGGGRPPKGLTRTAQWLSGPGPVVDRPGRSRGRRAVR